MEEVPAEPPLAEPAWLLPAVPGSVALPAAPDATLPPPAGAPASPGLPLLPLLPAGVKEAVPPEPASLPPLEQPAKACRVMSRDEVRTQELADVANFKDVSRTMGTHSGVARLKLF